ncbi:MAG TPA: serine/threonine-protein kinase [Polyangia bacterium]
MIGRVLGGRYRLSERLGQGGMGTVYRALHLLMDKPVAVKILRAELAGDNEAVARFHREARSASRLDHDHCIRVTDFGQSDDGLLFLVMELLDGTSLGHVTRRGPIPAARAAAIGVAVAEALAHAHEQGIIHRDLKPDNVFLARRARGRELVKVLDFGLAKLVADGALGPSITRDGTVFGTPEYMAPEQAEGDKLDGRTDLYALGIILYQLVTGDVPFRAGNFVALLTKQVTEAPLPPRERRPDLDIPAELEAAILRCLAKSPEARYRAAHELADALEPLAAGDSSQLMLLPTREGSPLSGARRLPPSEENPTVGDRPSQRLYSPPPSEPVRVRPRRRGRRLVALVGGAVVLAGAARFGWVEYARRETPKLVRPAPAPQPRESPAAEAERLLAGGDLAGADRLLSGARARGDSSPLEAALSLSAERHGNRLGALAHLETAARLAPADPAPRARLAALLHRLGYDADACKSARAALALVPAGTITDAVTDARSVLTQARCKEAPTP